jgi:UDP-N-acetylglucosamine:LPS N-acetylglucosamine transferase
VKLLLVASAGGHLQQLHWMRPFWEKHERVWVTFDTPEANALLAGEEVLHARHPTNRNVRALIANLGLARRVLREHRPTLVITTGAGVGVPFVWMAKARGIRSVFVEVYDRVDTRSLTGTLVAPFADAIILQRDEQQALYPRGRVLGPVR